MNSNITNISDTLTEIYTETMAPLEGAQLMSISVGLCSSLETELTTLINEVATKVSKSGDTMTGVLNMNNNKITQLATPTSAGDAVPLGYISDTSNLPMFFKTDGTSVMTGYINAGSLRIIHVGAPALYDDAATKQYVDDIVTTTLASAATSAASLYVPYSGTLIDVSMNNHKITNLATPTSTYDAVNKTYVDISSSTATTNAITSANSSAASLYLPLAGGTMTGQLIVSNSSDSSSPTTGAVEIVGGIGIQKSVHIGTQLYVGNVSTDSSAIIQADTTMQGFLQPRMTTTQKLAISSPANGLSVYDTTEQAQSLYNNDHWNIVLQDNYYQSISDSKLTKNTNNNGTASIPSQNMLYFDAANFTQFASATNFNGGVYDNKRYVYFCPNNNSSLFRYDTTKLFSDSASYDIFDMSSINIDCGWYSTCVFDGHYIYFIPHKNHSGALLNGLLTRYDISKPFHNIASYQTFDLSTVNANTVCYDNAIFEQGYIYFIPKKNDNVGFFGLFMRYNTNLSFTDINSYQFIDLQLSEAGSFAVGFNCAISDGRYIYLFPFANDVSCINTSLIVQFDTTGPFFDPNFPLTQLSYSFQTFYSSAVDVDSCLFGSCVFDGRFIYLTSYFKNNYTDYSSLITIYDTQNQNGFISTLSYSVYDISSYDSDYKCVTSSFFDGRYLYFISNPPSDTLGEITILDITIPFPPSYPILLSSVYGYSNAHGYASCVSDGVFLYLIPYQTKTITQFRIYEGSPVPYLLGTVGMLYANTITITNIADSISNTTGCLLLAGGIGISDSTDASSSTNGGTFTTAGGVAIAKKLYVGGITSITNSTTSTSNSAGCLLLSGGIGISKSTDASSSTNGGSFTTAGGMAIAKTLYANNIISNTNVITGFTTIATSGGSTSLSSSSNYIQQFTGSSAQTIILPSTAILGQSFYIINNSTGTLTVNSSGSNLVQTMTTATRVLVTALSTSPTSAAGWTVKVTPNTTNAGVVTLASGTVATSTTSGALVVTGGVGISGALYVSTTTPASISNTGVLTVTNATDSSTTTTGSVIITGGVGIAKSLYVSTTTPASISNTGVLTITNSTASTSNSTGSIIASGGIGLTNTTDATSSTNGGSFTTAGGMAIAKSLYIGGNVSTQNISYTKTYVDIAFGSPVQLLSTNRIIIASGGHGYNGIFQLPDATTLTVGDEFVIINNTASVNSVTINTFTGVYIVTVYFNDSCTFICTSTSDNTFNSWRYTYGYQSLAYNAQSTSIDIGYGANVYITSNMQRLILLIGGHGYSANIVMPDTSTLSVGFEYTIINTVQPQATIYSQNGDIIYIFNFNTFSSAKFICINTTINTLNAWRIYSSFETNDFQSNLNNSFAFDCTSTSSYTLTYATQKYATFTGFPSTNISITLPDVSTLAIGTTYNISNNIRSAAYILNIYTSSSANIYNIPVGSTISFISFSITDNSINGWVVTPIVDVIETNLLLDTTYRDTTTTTSYTLTNIDTHIQYFTGPNAAQLTLPQVSSIVVGKEYQVINVLAYPLTITVYGAYGAVLGIVQNITSFTFKCIRTNVDTIYSWGVTPLINMSTSSGNNIAFSMPFGLTDSTHSTSSSTGCFVINGGIGIGDTSDATSTTNGGSFTTAGGMAIAKNLYANNRIYSVTKRTTNGANITLSSTDSFEQYFTGGASQSVTLPAGPSIGFSFELFNDSSVNILIYASGGSLITSVNTATRIILICINASGTTPSDWIYTINPQKELRTIIVTSYTYSANAYSSNGNHTFGANNWSATSDGTTACEIYTALYGTSCIQPYASGVINSTIQYNVGVMATGLYTLKVSFVPQHDAAIVTITIVNASTPATIYQTLGSYDCYVPNGIITTYDIFEYFTIPIVNDGANIQIRFTAASKNASADNYYINLYGVLQIIKHN